MDSVEIVLANNDRVTLRVGDAFLKVDADHERSAREVKAIELAPVPTPDVLWHKTPVLALGAVAGKPLGKLGEPSTASGAAWIAAGAALRTLHSAPLPPWHWEKGDHLARRLDEESDWLVSSGVLPSRVVSANRELAEAVLRPWTPAFIHGDLHLEHLFVEGDVVTGIIDWSEASQGDAMFDLASLTLANEEHLGETIEGYGTNVDRDVIRGWWSWRSLVVVRWLFENGYGPPEDYPEVAYLRSRG